MQTSKQYQQGNFITRHALFLAIVAVIVIIFCAFGAILSAVTAVAR